jgi:hypothetical protein
VAFNPGSIRKPFWQQGSNRRGFLKGMVAGLGLSILHPYFRGVPNARASLPNLLFWVKDIPDQPFNGIGNGNYHSGVEDLLYLMGTHGLKFYRSSQETVFSGPSGMIGKSDVVLIKVNAQWKYRGSTNSDLIRGLIQRILDHPDGFGGEVVIIENGQGQGSLNGDALGWGSYPDNSVHANANDESHSFNYLVNTIFQDPRVSSYLLDQIRTNIIGPNEHADQGYRTFENVSYPCFTTAGNHRVELMEGIWQGNGYNQNLKLINVPVLKIHGGSEITASLKHFYGVLSMADGVDSGRHYTQLGHTCGKMAALVRTPILNIIDAIWVSHASLSGYPAITTFRANQILASQDPVALDYWAAKYILYPKTNLPQHLPTYSGIDQWLTSARNMINDRGGLLDPNSGIVVDQVTKNENEMLTHMISLAHHPDTIGVYRPSNGRFYLRNSNTTGVANIGFNTGLLGDLPIAGDWDGNNVKTIGVYRNGVFYLKTSNAGGAWDLSVAYGLPGDIPLAGDWTGKGYDSIGVYRPSNGRFYLRNSNTMGVGNMAFNYGVPGDIPLAGDWTGKGYDSIGVYRPSNGRFYLRNSNTQGIADITFSFGLTGGIPVVGDWNGDGIDTVGIYLNGTVYLRDSNSNGPADITFYYGIPGDLPIAGDWDGLL